MKITDKQIKDFISKNYGEHIEYDGVKIERNKTSFGNKIDVRIISFGKKITWFQGYEDDKFWSKFDIHTKWQLQI